MSSVGSHIILFFFTIGLCVCDFDSSCVKLKSIDEAKGLQSFDDLSKIDPNNKALKLIKNFNDGVYVSILFGSLTKLIKDDNRFFTVHKLNVEASDFPKDTFRSVYESNQPCDFKDPTDEVNKYLIGTDCIVKINSCVYDDYHIYVVGESVEGDMESKEISTWYKAQNIKVKLEIMKKFALELQALHKKGFYHNDLSPKFLYIRDLKDLSVTIRYPDTKEKRNKSKKVFYSANLPPAKLTFVENESDGSVDVYSLAMSFVLMESSKEKITEGMSAPCLSVQYLSHCHEALMENVNAILKKADMSELFLLFSSALDISSDYQYKSMERFVRSIDKTFDLVDEFNSNNNRII